MMAALNTAAITTALTTQITPVPLSGVLYRGVRLTTLLSKDPPQPLYVSTSENRFNLDGTRVLYFGENFVTAYSETVQENANLLRDSPIREHKTGAGYDVGDENEEPVVLFAARAAIRKRPGSNRPRNPSGIEINEGRSDPALALGKQSARTASPDAATGRSCLPNRQLSGYPLSIAKSC